MTYKNITEYVNAKAQYMSIPARANSNGIEYLLNGEWTKTAPPIPEFSRACMDNPDKTYIK